MGSQSEVVHCPVPQETWISDPQQWTSLQRTLKSIPKENRALNTSQAQRISSPVVYNSIWWVKSSLIFSPIPTRSTLGEVRNHGLLASWGQRCRDRNWDEADPPFEQVQAREKRTFGINVVGSFYSYMGEVILILKLWFRGLKWPEVTLRVTAKVNSNCRKVRLKQEKDQACRLGLNREQFSGCTFEAFLFSIMWLKPSASAQSPLGSGYETSLLPWLASS